MIRALTYEQMAEIESHFIFAREERIRVQEIVSEIAEESTYAMDPSGIHGTKITDETSSKAQKIERETRELRLWGEVVADTFQHFKDDVLMSNLLSMLYVEHLPADRIMEALYIGKTTLYEYRKEILRYGAIRAVRKGIMEI